MVWQVVLLGLALSGTLSGSCLAGLELPFLCLIRAVCIGLASEPGPGRLINERSQFPFLGCWIASRWEVQSQDPCEKCDALSFALKSIAM